MTSSVGVGAGPGRAQMLLDFGACVMEWQRALAQGPRPSHPSLSWLRSYSSDILPYLRSAGFGGISAHLGELLRRVDTAGLTGDPRESLRALLELAQQAQASLSPEERGAYAQLAAARAGGGAAVPVNGLASPRMAPASPQIPAPASPQPASAAPRAPQPALERSLLGLRAFGAKQLAEEPRLSGSLGSKGDARGTPGAARNVKELLGGIDRRRGRRVREARVEPSGKHSRSGSRRSSRVRSIAWGSIGVGVIGLVFAVAVVARKSGSAAVTTGTSPPIASQASVAPASVSGLLPSELLAADEQFAVVVAQVHGRGKESTELRALVNEQALLVARSAKVKCDPSAPECAQLAKLREAVAGQGGTKRLVKRRLIPSPERSVPRWLAGLELPDLPIEDDSRVQRSLEYYAERPVGRELFQGMLFRCGAHRELIESTLIRHGLPKDVFAVVFAESGCEPEAVSPVGAAGLWQLMPDTGRAYGLRVVKGVVDERRSAAKSTDAAIRFLRDLRDKMSGYYPKGVWDLVFGAYNMGPFAMAARVEQAGGDVGFWDLVDAARLPDETVHYAPTVQALAVILRNLQHFKFGGVQLRAPQLTSDLEVPPGTRLSLIARAASTSLDRIRSLNLDVMSDRTPDIKNFSVQVPKEVVWQARDTLAELTSARDESDQCVPPSFDWGRKHFTKEMADTCRRKLGINKDAASKAAGAASSSVPGQRG